MYPIPQRKLAQFYTLATYFVAIIGLCFLPVFAHFVMIFSWAVAFIPLAFCFKKQPCQSLPNLWQICFKLWGLQTIGLGTLLIFAVLWLSCFPNYADTNFLTTQHLSLNFLLETLAFASLLILLTQCMQKSAGSPILTHAVGAKPEAQHVPSQSHASILLFFPQKKSNSLGPVCMNFWFRYSTMVVGLLIIMLAGLNLWHRIPLTTGNLATLATLVLGILFCRSQWFYRKLQILTKRWRLNFIKILCLVLCILAGMNLFLDWMLQPFALSTIHLNLQSVGQQTPLLMFWGIAFCITVSLGFLASTIAGPLTPRMILFILLSNPILWALILLDFIHPILLLLKYSSHTFSVTLSIFALALSGYWLGSKKLAKLNVIFFMDTAEQHQNSMPRALIQDHIQLALTMLAFLSIQALFGLQVLVFATAGWIFLIYWIMSYHYVNILKKNNS